MRIEPGTNSQRIWQIYSKQAASPVNNAVNAQEAKDDVTVSNSARLFRSIVMAAKAAPDIREKKVNEIKNAIDSGVYKLDAGKIAEGMLSEVGFDEKA